MIYLSYRQLTIEKNIAPRFKYPKDPKENDRRSNHSWSGYDAWAQIKSMWYGHGKLFCMDTLPNLLALQSTLMSSSTVLDENKIPKIHKSSISFPSDQSNVEDFEVNKFPKPFNSTSVQKNIYFPSGTVGMFFSNLEIPSFTLKIPWKILNIKQSHFHTSQPKNN